VIDEKSRRTDAFDLATSAAITLADGRQWFIPKPWVALFPVIRDGKCITSFSSLTCGPDLDALIADIREVDGPDQIHAILSLGAFLLRRQYTLSDSELETLFVWTGDERTNEMLDTIMRTATGADPPKASSAGAD
jgi:hypothetical protein